MFSLKTWLMKIKCILLLMLFLIKESAAQWFQQNSGTTKNLSSVFFADANTGYIVGDSGTILKTLDGGLNWLTQNSLTLFPLYSVFFVSPDSGYAVGQNGTIIKTTDGGATWSSQASCTSFSLTSVYFPDHQTGYIVGMGSWEGGITLKTTDSGTTWNIINSDIWSLRSVYFTDADIGFVIGGHFYYPGSHEVVRKTMDGGTTWTNDTLSYGSGYLTSVYFTDSLNGFVAGAFGMPLGGGGVYSTSDGGNYWSWQFIPVYTSSVFFTSADTGYISGESSINGYGTVVKTVNGGFSWSGNLVETQLSLNSVFFTHADTGYVAGNHGMILKTTNGGGYPVGIKEQPKNGSLMTIHPNPVRDKLTIETSMKGTLTIFNFSNQRLLSYQVRKSTTTIDISNFPSGIYFIQIMGERMVATGRFVKH